MIPYARFLLDNLWRRAAGLPEREEPPEVTAPFERLVKTEWSVEFETLMRNRLLVGAYRYGTIGAPGKPRYDCCRAIQARIAKYVETGNRELLVDVANLALLEFVEGHHPLAHFRSADDEEHVGEVG